MKKLNRKHTATAAAWWIGRRVAQDIKGETNPADRKAAEARAESDLAWALRRVGTGAMPDRLMAEAAHRPGGVGCPSCTPSLTKEGAAS
ncbi:MULTISPECIES: hypothetical protein [Nocardiopsis]|uniref:Uncharacterized protein n=1 Tax=Nocardiopsis sinuspersici TaxID=501010 RepID=A0A1V3BWW9_9ACTN|nr:MULTISPECIES: hypothetical protein [Nocardiopsis]OOC52620.1 hypothetical protein NOSIN_01230 [Nocardiopsis sinuspersici]